MDDRPPWSGRRRGTLVGLALGAVAGALGAVALPAGFGVTAGGFAALCALLLVGAAVVFLAVPGPGTAGALARYSPLAGAVFVVAVLLLLSTSAQLRLVWSLAALGAAGWTAYAVWATRRTRE